VIERALAEAGTAMQALPGSEEPGMPPSGLPDTFRVAVGASVMRVQHLLNA